MPRVVHLTTVHDRFDNRVFHRECRSLADAGYEVVLLAPGEGTVTEGIRVGGLPRHGNRFVRMSLGVARTFLKALATPADLYHFHDPELIPAGLLLRLLGKRVVYDIHEDNRTALQEREYLPPWLRAAFAGPLGWIEEGASRHFHLVLAERYYAERFPRGEAVLNYVRFPRLDEDRLAARPRGTSRASSTPATSSPTEGRTSTGGSCSTCPMPSSSSWAAAIRRWPPKCGLTAMGAASTSTAWAATCPTSASSRTISGRVGPPVWLSSPPARTPGARS